jgi:hypothetical protein
MHSTNSLEHFVTLFDSSFLPMGMALHKSLLAHAQPFHLWILCMDETVEGQLELLSLPHVTLLPLATVETPELLAVKGGRSKGEYCWTLTPFSFTAVFNQNANIERVTYLDADLFFFADPHILLREMDEAGKHVLITEHAYAPEYAMSLLQNGRFCVQFLTFRRTMAAERVLHWWQKKCLEWCFDRLEEGKFGDQMYLDTWPQLFADEVCIVQQTDKTLAPWNELHFEKYRGGKLEPVFYHFHGFRIVRPRTLQLFMGYAIGKHGLILYEAYVDSFVESLRTMRRYGFSLPIHKVSAGWRTKFKLRIHRKLRYTRLTV